MQPHAQETFAEAPTGGRTARMLVFAIRRMATFGLNDAHAAHAALTHFGLSYRRPLILTRTMMSEIARASKQTVMVAPCCCARITKDEATLLSALGCANSDTPHAHFLLSDLMGTPDCLGAVTTAQALSQACADLGKPLEMFRR
ncbi:DUF6628 family protein [Sphingobium boeckii]|uniref:Uncharacterized protein n=1 Tax=Sphingobium boeckii TaxID=1082345 RepID=A0A7W9AJR9_9SPHN|nr:DUF6628 family protein [Sphingobium boeckii]MBB5686940.1 hypothetical protein [Sphingobium boeckii]